MTRQHYNHTAFRKLVNTRNSNESNNIIQELAGKKKLIKSKKQKSEEKQLREQFRKQHKEIVHETPRTRLCKGNLKKENESPLLAIQNHKNQLCKRLNN